MELIESARYYEARSAGLGDRFLDEINAGIGEIRAAPDRWEVVEGDLRRYILQRFPFSIFYRMRQDELRILVVMHQRRRPDYWRHRLRD